MEAVILLKEVQKGLMRLHITLGGRSNVGKRWKGLTPKEVIFFQAKSGRMRRYLGT